MYELDVIFPISHLKRNALHENEVIYLCLEIYSSIGHCLASADQVWRLNYVKHAETRTRRCGVDIWLAHHLQLISADRTFYIINQHTFLTQSCISCLCIKAGGFLKKYFASMPHHYYIQIIFWRYHGKGKSNFCLC